MTRKYKKSFFKFGECRSKKISIEISKRHRHRKEEEDKSQTEEEEDENNTLKEIVSPLETNEKFSTVDLSSSDETNIPQSIPKGEPFMDRLKNSTVRKLFKSDSKESEISIYTIGQGMGKPNNEENLENNIIRTRLRQSACNEPDSTIGSHERSVACQASSYPPFRLYFLPPNDWEGNDGRLQTILKFLSCQCTLACFLIFWLLISAFVFYLTEGPNELTELHKLSASENTTMISMATDLRIIEDDWDEILIKYMEKHKKVILSAVISGYNNGTITWTYTGSLLSAVSILTTFGLAAPLPTTSGGIIGAIILTILGLPIHIILIVHLGRTVALKIQIFAKEAENKVADIRQHIISVRRFGEEHKQDTWPEKMFMVDFVPPSWLYLFPFITFFLYYIMGILIFGIARNLPTSEIFVFFVDFSKGYSSNGFSKIGYAWYLEGLAILTGINIAILRDAPMPGLFEFAQTYGLVTNSID